MVCFLHTITDFCNINPTEAQLRLWSLSMVTVQGSSYAARQEVRSRAETFIVQVVSRATTDARVLMLWLINKMKVTQHARGVGQARNQP